jgi:hypothetical protein
VGGSAEGIDEPLLFYEGGFCSPRSRRAAAL